MPIDPDHLELVKLHDPYVFDERFVECTRECDTYEEAYDLVEQEYKSVFGKRKYSNYNSYRVARRKRIKARHD
ncbi:MAG: hypothetical protein CL666_04730 [Balneola sp.]|nr:hypothetical protein [Balneola sp.]